jgi:hypothetical protein
LEETLGHVIFVDTQEQLDVCGLFNRILVGFGLRGPAGRIVYRVAILLLLLSECVNSIALNFDFVFAGRIDLVRVAHDGFLDEADLVLTQKTLLLHLPRKHHFPPEELLLVV